MLVKKNSIFIRKLTNLHFKKFLIPFYKSKLLLLIPIVLVLLAAMSTYIYLYYSPNKQISSIFPVEQDDEEKRKTETDELTNKLLEINDHVINNEPTQKSVDNMIDIATKRKQRLLEELKQNPQGFLDQAILAQQRSKFPKEIQSLLEKEVDINGRLSVSHTDNFKNETTTSNVNKFNYHLEVLTDKHVIAYSLYFATNKPNLSSGSRIGVRGIELDQNIALQTGSFMSGENYSIKLIEATVPSSIGSQKTAVILVNFVDNTSQPFSTNQIKDILFDNESSVKNYYLENSFNKAFKPSTSDVAQLRTSGKDLNKLLVLEKSEYNPDVSTHLLLRWIKELG